MKKLFLPDIPNSWLVAALLLGLVILRGFGIDTYVTAGIASVTGYILGKHVEQTRHTM